ncbi:MAG: hypothetical protein HY868_07510 [Chloroflexi bacterium]|nr:hypothetical protein [Chloroflexota bacterium]
MAIYYFDASAIVKRYVREPESIWTRPIGDARDESGSKLNRVVIADISRVEVAAAFAISLDAKRSHPLWGNAPTCSLQMRLTRITAPFV